MSTSTFMNDFTIMIDSNGCALLLVSVCCSFEKNVILISHFDLMPFNMKQAENKKKS